MSENNERKCHADLRGRITPSQMNSKNTQCGISKIGFSWSLKKEVEKKESPVVYETT